MTAIVTQLGLAPDELAGQTAVVTGGGRGIGRETALALAALGARVVVADIDDAAGRQTESLIRTAGGTAAYVHADVSLEGDVARLAMWTLADFGPASLLVNNAIVSPVASLLETPPDLWDQVIAVNLRGAYLTCRAFVPGMLLLHHGRIINMVSTDAMAHMPAYMASKQGLAGFSRSIAAELGHEGVQVVALEPGFVDSPGLLTAAAELAPRLGMAPEDFAKLSFHPGYDGMMPAAHAGAATAYLGARLMADYHGEVVTGYTVLERAGFLSPDGTEALPSVGRTAADTLTLSRRLEAMLRETEAEFGQLPLFVRPLARSGFRSKAGQSLADWMRTAANLTRQLETAPAAVPAGLLRQLEQLAQYYQGVPAETARFTKDEALLATVARTSAERVATIGALCGALRPTKSSP